MKIVKYLLIFCIGLNLSISAQNLNALFTNVDTLFLPGAALGSLELSGSNATPIISNSPCEQPQMHFAIAAQYQNGRAIAIAHEGILSNNSINSYDNLEFLKNVMDWLNGGSKRVAMKYGWASSSNTSIFQNALISNAYSFSTIGGNITTASLSNSDILVLGNDWNGTQNYQASELSAIDNFVANGGAVLIAGLGWSWPQALNLYPMNNVANLFGIEFTRDVLRDAEHNINGSAKLYNFYPDNLDSSTSPHCSSPFVGRNIARGDTLGVLRLAVSTNGEFTQQSGGVGSTDQLIQQWLQDINDMYGREYSVRFELIPNNTQLIFPDPTTDPWGTLPPGSGGCTNAGIILGRQAQVFDSILGSSAYDISHVVVGSPFGGGCASGLKSGVSGGLNIPVTRHEMGHQLAQSHTINYSDNNNYELETGAWTVQGGNSQGRAHAVSYHQLARFLRDGAAAVGTKIPTGNTIPSVDAGGDYVIPISTPFQLKAVASDPDPSDSLTYVWDNLNRGLPQSLPLLDDSQGAWFMRLLPDTSRSRTFPKMADVIANNNANSQEQLPSQARILDIRLSVNDNHQIMYNGQLINASGTYSDDVQITVAAAGPFEVTSQNSSGIVYPGGMDQIVSWAVNGTDSLPINTQNVRIELSTDGGWTYPYILSPSTPNTGSAVVTMPNISTNTARIKVSALNSIYFDLNTHDFEIQMGSVGLEEESNRHIDIYPNPTSQNVYLDLPWKHDFEVRVYNINGSMVYQNWNETTLNVGHLPAGVYVLEMINHATNERFIEKLVVI